MNVRLGSMLDHEYNRFLGMSFLNLAAIISHAIESAWDASMINVLTIH